jgi:hypothetical protein
MIFLQTDAKKGFVLVAEMDCNFSDFYMHRRARPRKRCGNLAAGGRQIFRPHNGGRQYSAALQKPRVG